MSKNKSMRFQAKAMLKPLLRLGESRNEAKKEAIRKAEAETGKKISSSQIKLEGIYSTSTYKNYVDAATKFGEWAKAKHGEKELKNCRKYVAEYLKERIGKVSAPTVARDASALSKLYRCSSADFGVELPKRRRQDITRSRSEVKGFDYEKHKDILDFIRGTGLRRCELRYVRVGDFYKSGGDLYVNVKNGKGGKSRAAKVQPEYREGVEKHLEGKRKDEKTFKRGDIPNRAPIHAYRAKYAQDMYKKLARPLEALTSEQKYYCRKDKKGEVYDRKALLEVSRLLGHNRVEVVASHYLY